MKPSSVNSQNSSQVWINLYEKKHLNRYSSPKFHVGDKVRISIEKTTFQKRYDQIWTEEIFIITHIIRGAPTVYKLKDQADEALKGTFYPEELQKVAEPDAYRIEKVIRKKKNTDGSVSYLVKWKGYPEKFNSFVSETDLQEL